MKLKFSSAGVAFLSNYIPVHDIRYYLNGIYFTPIDTGGALAIATNGHMLGAWFDKHGFVERPVIATITKPLAAACKGREVCGAPVELVNVDGRLTCMQNESEIFVQANVHRKPDPSVMAWEIEGKFPDPRRVIPRPSKAVNGTTNHFNADYLATIAKSFPRPFSRTPNNISLKQVERDRSILITCENHPQAVVVLMPVKEYGGNTGSAWLEQFLGPEVKAA